MNLSVDPELLWLTGGVLALLVLATVIGLSIKGRGVNEELRATIDNVNARVRAWWVMCAVFAIALLTGKIGSVVLFGLTSFLALREFITLTPTKRGDHRSLFWVFFIITPIQYVLVARGGMGCS